MLLQEKQNKKKQPLRFFPREDKLIMAIVWIKVSVFVVIYLVKFV